jgi:hypothetical protein
MTPQAESCWDRIGALGGAAVTVANLLGLVGGRAAQTPAKP